LGSAIIATHHRLTVKRRGLTCKWITDDHRASTAAGEHSMTLDHYDAANGRNSLVVSLESYFTRYRMPLYLVFAAAASLSVVWNWNWLSGAEVFRILAALPCTLMMLMCMKRASCNSQS
jgi:hypothetical protein